MTKNSDTHGFYIRALIAKQKKLLATEQKIRTIKKMQAAIVKDWLNDVNVNGNSDYPKAYDETITAFVDGELWQLTIDEDCHLSIEKSSHLFLNGDDLI